MIKGGFDTLNGQGAIGLWLQGCAAWNEWVEDNPNYNIDFSNVDFSEYRKGFPVISFDESVAQSILRTA